jgi:predicted TIM-barrel fold metal-dependent hydrolase
MNVSEQHAGATYGNVIDFHTHVFPDALASRALAAFAKFPLNVYSNGTVRALFQDMDKAGVSASVLLSVPTRPQQVESVNNFLSRFLDNSRLIPFAGVHPNHSDPVGVVRRVAEAGFRGIKLHPLMQAFHPQARRLFPLYDAAIAEGLVILMHASTGLESGELFATPAEFDQLFMHYDYQRFVLAHLGGRPELHGAAAPNPHWPCYLDLACTIGDISDDNLLDAVRSYGTTRVLFATDSPWHSAQLDIKRLNEVGFTQDELQALLSGNAAKLLAI